MARRDDRDWVQDPQPGGHAASGLVGRILYGGITMHYTGAIAIGYRETAESSE